MSKPTLRVYFITHHNGHRSGVLLRTQDAALDVPPPSAYGSSEEDVLRQLETILLAREVGSEDTVERYLWDTPLFTQQLSVDIHPLTANGKNIIVGKKVVPLRMTFVYAPLLSGAFHVMLPRFGGRAVVEELSLAPELFKHAVSSMLVGESPHWLYDFRHEGDEYVREWEPRLLLRNRSASSETDEDDSSFETLRSVSDELVDKALRHKLPPVFGDLDDVRAHQALFAQRPLPSLLLVGRPGVGKSSWVRKLARYFAEQKREGGEDLVVPRIWSTSADRLIAGMVYLGMWQERCLAIVDELNFEFDYLHVDRLASLLTPQSDNATIADVLRPAIVANELSLIAECTDEELERCRRRDPSLIAQFRVIRVDEMHPAAMVGVLDRYVQRKDGDVRIHADGLKRLVRYLATFQRDMGFPGKGFRFIDWLNQESEKRPRMLYPRDVADAYARYSGLPVALIADDVTAGVDEHASKLREQVIGQDGACQICAQLLSRFKAGLNDPERPSGTLLFVGPTGVGKTELAKQLARYVFGSEDRMIRLDMSEYMLPGSSARMIEVGRGVLSLAQRVREQPLSVVLLDEIEKADAEVFDLLLGILGEGRLTDSSGRLVDFRMTLIVMTSNLGVTERASVGFGGGQDANFVRSVRAHFRPEFFNRIDHVVPFRSLAQRDIERIVDLEMEKANRRTGLVRRNLSLHLSPEARGKLALLGHDPRHGARPLKRVIEEKVITPLAARMAKEPSLRDLEVWVVSALSEAPQAAAQGAIVL